MPEKNFGGLGAEPPMSLLPENKTLRFLIDNS